MRRNLGDGLSSNDEDDYEAEEDASVQIEFFGSPEVDDEGAAAAAVSSLLPAPFSRTGRVRSTDLFTRNMA